MARIKGWLFVIPVSGAVKFVQDNRFVDGPNVEWSRLSNPGTLASFCKRFNPEKSTSTATPEGYYLDLDEEALKEFLQSTD